MRYGEIVPQLQKDIARIYIVILRVIRPVDDIVLV
jgi:hypothetical protein